MFVQYWWADNTVGRQVALLVQHQLKLWCDANDTPEISPWLSENGALLIMNIWTWATTDTIQQQLRSVRSFLSEKHGTKRWEQHVSLREGCNSISAAAHQWLLLLSLCQLAVKNVSWCVVTFGKRRCFYLLLLENQNKVQQEMFIKCCSSPAGTSVGSVTTQISAIQLTMQGQPTSMSSSSSSPSSPSPLMTEECLVGETQGSRWGTVDYFSSSSHHLVIMRNEPCLCCVQLRVCDAGGRRWGGAAWWAGECL